MTLLKDITMNGLFFLLFFSFQQMCVSGALSVKVVQPHGIESVNGSDINMGCTSPLVDSNGVMICDSSSNNYLVDGCSPAIDTSTSVWASQLVTVRKTKSDRVTTGGDQYDHVLLTFGFDTAVTLTRIELDLFLCPDMNIGAPYITVYAEEESNLVFTYDPVNNNSLPFLNYNPSQSSCDSLSIVNITFENDGLAGSSYITWHILIYSFTSSIDWVYVGEVRFLGMDVPTQDSCAPLPTNSTIDPSATTISPSESPNIMSNTAATLPSSTPSKDTQQDPGSSSVIYIAIGVVIAVIVLVVLIVVVIIVIVFTRRRKFQLKLDSNVDNQPSAIELKSVEDDKDNSTAANPLYTQSTLINGQHQHPETNNSAGVVDNTHYYSTAVDPGTDVDDDMYTIVEKKKTAPDENMYASVSEAKSKMLSNAPTESAPVYATADDSMTKEKTPVPREKEATPPVYSDIHKPLSPPVPNKSEELQVYLAAQYALSHPQPTDTTLSTKPSKVNSLPQTLTVGMSDNPNYESADALSQHSAEADSALYAQPYFHTTRSTTSVTPDSEGIYSEPIQPSDFTRVNGTKQPEKGIEEEEGDPRMYSSIYTLATTGNEHFQQKVEITTDNIIEQREIGMGQFGKVVLATTNNLSLKDMRMSETDNKCNISVYVAVKKLRCQATKSQREAFEKEIKFMSLLNDPNVVRFLGVCYQEPAFIIMEYMEKGDLSSFLQKYSAIVLTPTNEDEIATRTITNMTLQIASGMKYLASKNFVHRDLASRNCLVGEDFVVKLADFGMSRNLYESHYYRIHGNAVLPIRWMATECFYGMFSEKTDVWAFGITVWELFTLTKDKPYPEFTDAEVVDDAVNKGTIRWLHPRPPACPESVYDIMKLCWIANPKERATFESLHAKLQKPSSN